MIVEFRGGRVEPNKKESIVEGRGQCEFNPLRKLPK